jgi:hypothetical protein
VLFASNADLNRRAAIVIVVLSAAGLTALFVWRGPSWNLREAPLKSPAAAATGSATEPLFEDVTARVGIDFVHDPGRITLYQLPQVTGPGCAFLDFDQDGDLDILLVNQAAGAGYEGLTEPVSQNAGGPTSRLYRQEPDGRFVDVTQGSGLDVTVVGLGVAVGDINNDGFPDVYLACYGADRLFLNRRDGTFADITSSAGIDNLLWGTSCAFVDFDRDGWLDLYIANYVDYHPTRRCTNPDGEQEFCNPKTFSGTPHKLYRNESGELAARQMAAGEASAATVRFRDVSLSSGIARKTGPGLGVVAADFDGDRWPDFFVANDGAANFLWINQHDGTFSEEAVLRGAAYDLTGHPQANMGIAVGDLDGDGRLDLLVTHFQGEMNALYLNKSADGFEESAATAGLGLPGLKYTKWGAAFFDVDHDGDLDLAVVNGRVKRSEFSADPPGNPARHVASVADWQSYAEPNQFFLNDGAGHFSELASTSEPFCMRAEIWRGLAVGDVDNDGDLDLLATCVAGPARLFLNVARKHGHWLQIRAIEPALGGRDAYGALVTVFAGQNRWIRNVNPAFSYLSSNDPRLHFGLGDIEQVDRISVIWADGIEEVFFEREVDRHLVVRRGEGHSP